MIDVKGYRVETEATRLVLAWVAILFAIGVGISWVIIEPGFLIPIAGVPLYFWFRGRMREAELLGQAVEVTERNYPIVNERIVSVKAALGAEGMVVRTYIVASGDYNLSMERHGRRRILVINGKVLEDLPSLDTLAEIDYVVGRFVGAFQLRHMRFGRLLFLVGISKIPLVGFAVKPWLRATVLTGDRVGLLASGNLESAMRVMAKLSVGPEAVNGYRIAGHVEQARSVQGGLFYVLKRWGSEFPHAGDRVVQLIQFARKSDAVRTPIGPNQEFVDDLSEALRAVN